MAMKAKRHRIEANLGNRISMFGTRVVRALKNALLLCTFLILFPLFAYAVWCLVKGFLWRALVSTAMFFIFAIVNYMTEV